MSEPTNAEITNAEIRERHNNLQTWANAYGGELPDTKAYIPAHEHRGILLDRLEAALAKIDLLMLEYCPEDMTKEQVRIWGENQIEASDAEERLLSEALGKP